MRRRFSQGRRRFSWHGSLQNRGSAGTLAQLTKPCCDQKQKEFRTSWRRLGHPQLASKKSTVKNGDGRAGRGRGGLRYSCDFLRVVTTGWPRRLAECARCDDWRTSLMCLRDVTTRWLARDDAKCTPRPTPPSCNRISGKMLSTVEVPCVARRRHFSPSGWSLEWRRHDGSSRCLYQ